MIDTPHAPTRSDRRDPWFFAGAALLLLPSIWSPCSITGQDEYFLSFRTVLEMQARDEWLTPYVNGEVRLQKPPLLYWLMRCSFLVFGPNLFAARIWTVLFGAGLALFTAKLSRRCSGAAAGSGYLAGLIALGAAGVMIDARRAMFDLPVGCLCTAAIYYSVRWRSQGLLRHALLAGVALAAAAMTKGPVALWFFLAPGLAALGARPGPAAGPWWHGLAAATVFAGLALPWPAWVQAAHPTFWAVMEQQAASRELGAPPLDRPLKLTAAALGLIVPWSVAVVAGARAALRRHAPATTRWLALWVLVGVAPFVFMKTFERYLLALVCPMALLAAGWLATAGPRLQRLHLIVAVCLVGVPVLVFSTFAAWFQLAYLAPLVTVALLWTTWRRARRPHPDATSIAARCAVLLSLLLGFVYPSLGINQLPKDLPADLATSEVRTFGRPQPGMLSMQLGRSVQEFDGRPAGLGERLARYRGYLFALSGDAARLERAARARGVQVERVRAFRSFYSRKAWLKFFKQGADAGDWREALAARSPEVLKPRFICFRIG